MSSIDRKYFKVTGDLKQLVIDYRTGPIEDFRAQMKKFLDKFDTDGFVFKKSLQGMRVVGFEDTGIDYPGIKLSPEGYRVPDRRTKTGKLLQLEMSSLVRPEPKAFEEAINYDGPWLIESYFWSYRLINCGDEIIFSMPDGIEDPQHPELIKIKTWEALKLIDESKPVGNSEGDRHD